MMSKYKSIFFQGLHHQFLLIFIPNLIMKSAIIILAVVAAAAALPQRGGADQDTTITRSEFENTGENFNWVSELSDGFVHQQSGQLKTIGKEQGIAITGSYSYVAPDGQVIKVDYVADENGFQPVGAHIPQPEAAGGSPARSAPRPAQRAAARRF